MRSVLVVGLALSFACAGEPARKPFAIPAGNALTTFKQFSTQAGGRLLYAADAVDGVKTRSVQGMFSPQEALERMLAGTELEVVRDDQADALTVRRRPRVRPGKRRESPPIDAPVAVVAADETVQLPQFTIQSERDLGYAGRQTLSTTRTGTPTLDLPQSVVALNKAFFDELNPTILAKALNYVGGAQTGTINWSVDRYMLRGFVGEGDYVDGFRTQTDKNTDLNLVDHVEIIKGPSAIFIANQSNTVGGVINKVSKSPTDYHIGRITLQAGLWDGNRADLDVGGPLTDDAKWMWRLLVAGQDSKGYYDFTYEKRTSVLPMLGYRFNENTEIWVKYERFNSHYSSYNGIPLDGRTNRIADVPWTTNFNEDTPLNWRTDWFTRLWGQFTTRPSDFLAIRVAAFDSRDTQRRVESILSPVGATVPSIGADGAVSFAPFPQYVVPPTYVNGQSLPRIATAINADEQPRRELQNDYVFTFSTGPAAHTLLLGLDGIDYPQTTRTYSTGALSTAVAGGVSLDAPHPGAITVNFDQPPANLTHREQTFAKVYALETASFVDNRLLLSFGFTRNRFALSSTSTTYDQRAGVAGATTGAPETLLYKNLYQYGVVFKPLPAVSAFYGFNKNFSANGMQFGQFLPPQEGEQNEFGVKSEWLDRRVSVAINHFEITQRNNSVPAFPQTTPPSQVLVAGASSRGWDGDFAASLTRQIDLIGSFAWMRARVPLPPPWNRAPQPYDGRAHRELPVNNVSERNFAMWTRYRFTGPLRGLSLAGGVSYLARRAITDNANLVFYGYVPARTLVDAAVSYETNRLRYQLNIDNLFDRRYIFAVRSNQVIVPGSPTNLRASIAYKF